MGIDNPATVGYSIGVVIEVLDMLEVYLVNTYAEMRDRLYFLNKEIDGYGITDPFTELEGDAQTRYLWLLDARDSLEEAIEALGRLRK